MMIMPGRCFGMILPLESAKHKARLAALTRRLRRFRSRKKNGRMIFGIENVQNRWGTSMRTFSVRCSIHKRLAFAPHELQKFRRLQENGRAKKVSHVLQRNTAIPCRGSPHTMKCPTVFSTTVRNNAVYGPQSRISRSTSG